MSEAGMGIQIDEVELARAIDRLDAVKHWVRNVGGTPGDVELETAKNCKTRYIR